MTIPSEDRGHQGKLLGYMNNNERMCVFFKYLRKADIGRIKKYSKRYYNPHSLAKLPPHKSMKGFYDNKIPDRSEYRKMFCFIHFLMGT